MDEIQHYVDPIIKRDAAFRDTNNKALSLSEITQMKGPCTPATIYSRVPNGDIMKAALKSLNTWINGGPAPVSAPRFVVDEHNKYVRNVNGQLLGGIRTAAQDATVNTYFGDTLFASMHGREEISKVFSGFIENFSALYHINGQMTVDINGDHANSTHYCLVVLISDDEHGKKFKNFNGVIYNDDYVRQNGQWLIAKRVARFTWRDIDELVIPS